ncbi:glutaminase A [Bauldia litoralis]|uniref:Glutaminase n=1 Tax=Bauldia litoralis TaxID=665467 RepID=A0A1G6AFF7_9HYPH|nr:glutaminase A [Bauldia litoralis]SDB07046.1 L-glutaminase [Bauldia litoralis]
MEAKSPLGAQSSIGPIDHYLADLHQRIAGVTDGEIATYIPELARADPETFGIAIATVDGRVYTVGDADHPFTIQSISKAFVYGYTLAEYGRDFVLSHIGVEPTGEAFNSIVLDEVHNRPYNPMVNAGAMAAAELIKGDTPEARIATMLGTMSKHAGRSLHIDESVLRSEQATGHRNRAIAYMMLNSGMIHSAPETILDIYFRQCSVRVSCTDLAVMAATLANDGVNPLTGETALDRDYIQDVLTVMNSCGMYNYAGQWSYEIGMPAKSGVAGGIIAVIPGQIGIGVFSPRLDAHGHSVRGVRVCAEISETFGLHVFRNHTNSGAVIRRELSGTVVRSKRVRSPQERSLLDDKGDLISVVEVQGGLFFGSTERLVRRVDAIAAEAEFIVLDLRRVHDADKAARRLLRDLLAWLRARDRHLVFAHLPDDGPLASLRDEMTADDDTAARVFDHRDQALEWCENQLIAEFDEGGDRTKFSLGQLDIFKGLDRDDLRVLEGLVRPMVFEPGQTIVREGDEANLFFVVARGTVTIQLRLDSENESERLVRVASMGPGVTFGEMALLDGGYRSADVVADERVVCYGFSVEQLREVGKTHPALFTTILGNMMRDFSERLRRANDEIRALEQ